MRTDFSIKNEISEVEQMMQDLGQKSNLKGKALSAYKKHENRLIFLREALVFVVENPQSESYLSGFVSKAESRIESIVAVSKKCYPDEYRKVITASDVPKLQKQVAVVKYLLGDA